MPCILSKTVVKLLAVIIMRNQLRSSLLLMLATIIWGSAFVSQKIGMDHIGPFTFQAVRSFMAVIGMLPVIYLLDRNKEDG